MFLIIFIKKLKFELIIKPYHNYIYCTQMGNQNQSEQQQMETVKFLNLIQTDPDAFNKNQKELQEKYKSKYGEKAWERILWSDKHNDLKSNKTVDYRLTEDELLKLQTDLVLLKQLSKPVSYAKAYLNLYNNDMPVMITSDSILYAFHKFYDDWLKCLESTTLSTKLFEVCNLMLASLYSVEQTEQNIEYLKALEVYFMVPKVLLSLQNEMNETIISEPTLLFSIEETKLLFTDVSKERIQEELLTYEKIKFDYFSEYNNINKFVKFINPDCDSHSASDYVRKSPKLFAAYKYFKQPDVNEKIMFKFGGEDLFNSIISSIANMSDIEMDMCGVTIKINGSLLKPRGHYTESLQLKNYFRAFSFISKFDVTIVKNNNLNHDGLVLAAILSKISEAHVEEIDNFQTFIGKIIGSGDNYSIKSFLELLNKHMPQTNLNDSITYILSNTEKLFNDVMTEDLKRSKMTKFGDTNFDGKSISFSLISKGTQVDNEIISQFVDNELLDDEGNCPKRKFPSILDLLYALFDNKDVLPKLKSDMDVQYNNHLEKVKEKYVNHNFDNTLYGQELKMLRALTNDKLNASPFNTQAWGLKQAVTQTGFYSDMKHDNCLYIEECFGFRDCCSHPDLMVEPVLTFWREFLNTISIMKSLPIQSKKDEKILNNFETILNKFIIVTEKYLNNEEIDETLLTELKTICKAEYHGSGGPTYDGWYFNLFRSEYDAFKVKPECSTWFTAVDDDRGTGGICTLGNYGTRLMYSIVTDNNNQSKILLGPTYNTYSFKTAYDDRLNDEEFGQRINKFTPLTF